MGRKRNIEPIMKSLATAALITFGALCLHADDQTTTQTPAPQTTAQQPQADSPLVRAAKASGRMNSSKKKTPVITNETLSKTGGHVTTTNKPQPALPKPPIVDTAAKARADAEKEGAAVKAADAKAKKEAEETQKKAAERSNAILEGDDPEGIYEDPALSEGRAQATTPQTQTQTQQPPTMKVQKPPAF